jgi:DNA-binding NtrC family response regulator
VIIIEVPPLRERKEDIPLLVEHFIAQICAEQGRAPVVVTPEAVEKLTGFYWSGNIRELRNVIERLVILSEVEITAADIERYVEPSMLN